MSPLRELIRNIASNWFGLALNIVISFFLAPYVVRHLGDEYYGLWAVVMQFSGYIYLLDLGVRESVIRQSARASVRNTSLRLGRVVTVSLGMYTAIALAALVAAVLLALLMPHWVQGSSVRIEDAQLAVVIAGATIGVGFVFNMFSGLLLGHRRFDIVNYIAVPVVLLRAGLIVLALGAGYKIVALSWIQLGVSVLNGCGLLVACAIFLKRHGTPLRLVRMRFSQAVRIGKRLLGFSGYVLVNNIGQRVVFASDALVISIFLPIGTVTYYAIAGNLINYLRQLAVTTAQVFNPLSSFHQASRNPDLVRQSLERSVSLTLFVSIPVVAAYAVLGDIFIGLWMGPKYAELSGMVLLVLAIGQVMSAPHHAITSILYGLGAPELIARLRVVEAAVNLLLSVVLVNFLGLLGVALGTTIPHLVLTALVLPIVICRKTGMSVSRFYGNVVGRCLLGSLPFVVLVGIAREYWSLDGLLEFFICIGLMLSVHVVMFAVLFLSRADMSHAFDLAVRSLSRVPIIGRFVGR